MSNLHEDIVIDGVVRVTRKTGKMHDKAWCCHAFKEALRLLG